MLKPNLNHDKLTLFARHQRKASNFWLILSSENQNNKPCFQSARVLHRCDRAVGIESHNSFFNERLHHAAQCLNQDTGFYKQLS